MLVGFASTQEGIHSENLVQPTYRIIGCRLLLCRRVLGVYPEPDEGHLAQATREIQIASKSLLVWFEARVLFDTVQLYFFKIKHEL